MVGVLGCEFVEDCPLCTTMELNMLTEPPALPVFAQTQPPLSLRLRLCRLVFPNSSISLRLSGCFFWYETVGLVLPSTVRTHARA